ncbi:thioredoxin domain-containing protein 12 [Calliopsis andreniformis]|uniref:thioredoxin domain-containing protein 12 n=1 Tax=Calliopsis andreniformis TaxID=337506 RepID=UPI003FCC86AB
MIQYIKYLSSLNLINLANHIVANTLLNTGETHCDSTFEQLYKWRSFKDGFEEAKITNKPVFLLIHKFTCPACHKLKYRLTKSVRLMDLSDRFVMIKIEMIKNDRNLSNKEKFQPDGKYVPRILFFTPDGNLIKEAYNKHPSADQDYRYFYNNSAQVIDTMLFVLKEYCKDPSSVIFDHAQWKSEICDTDNEILTPTVLH